MDRRIFPRVFADGASSISESLLRFNDCEVACCRARCIQISLPRDVNFGSVCLFLLSIPFALIVGIWFEILICIDYTSYSAYTNRIKEHPEASASLPFTVRASP